MIPSGAVRNIWQTPLIPISPFVMRTDLPPALQNALREALLTMQVEAVRAAGGGRVMQARC
jgi:ABC-type phosphate/phosphonate transport system substrate-binding protein